MAVAPQHEVAFKQGQIGEEGVAASLEQRVADSPSILLHDRRMPKGRGSIDHIAVAASGIYVIHAKHYSGDVSAPRPLLGSQKLLIAGRDRSSLIDGLDRQVAAVRAALGPARENLLVQGVLCFTKAELPMLRTLDARRSHPLPQSTGQASTRRDRST